MATIGLAQDSIKATTGRPRGLSQASHAPTSVATCRCLMERRCLPWMYRRYICSAPTIKSVDGLHTILRHAPRLPTPIRQAMARCNKQWEQSLLDMAAVRGASSGALGSLIPRSANPRIAATHHRLAARGAASLNKDAFEWKICPPNQPSSTLTTPPPTILSVFATVTTTPCSACLLASGRRMHWCMSRPAGAGRGLKLIKL
jgi:hypothetical protein